MKIINDSENGYLPDIQKTHDAHTCERISKIMKQVRQKVKMEHVSRHTETEPEKRFKDIISKFDLPYDIYQWYHPKKYVEGFEKNYELDFAIPDLKISFEINGNFHYDTTTWELKEYYKGRRDYIESFGWTQIDIHYLICFDEQKLRSIIEDTFNGKFRYDDEVTKEIKSYYMVNPPKKKKKQSPEVLLNKLYKTRSKSKDIDKEVHDRVKDYQLEKLKEYLKENPDLVLDIDSYISKLKEKNVTILFLDGLIDKLEAVKNSGVDFSTLGWISKLAKKLSMTRGGTRAFVKVYAPYWYEEKCFKVLARENNNNTKQQIDARDKRKDLILNSGIDFTKPRWVSELKTLLNIKERSTVINWLKRNMPEFLKTYLKFDYNWPGSRGCPKEYL